MCDLMILESHKFAYASQTNWGQLRKIYVILDINYGT